MERIIQLFDEIDDVLAPLLAMATPVDLWRTFSVAGAVAGAIFTGSPIALVAGLVLVAAGELFPSRIRPSAVQQA